MNKLVTFDHRDLRTLQSWHSRRSEQPSRKARRRPLRRPSSSSDQAKASVESQPDKAIDKTKAHIHKAKAHHHAKVAKDAAKDIASQAHSCGVAVAACSDRDPLIRRRLATRARILSLPLYPAHDVKIPGTAVFMMDPRGAFVPMAGDTDKISNEAAVWLARLERGLLAEEGLTLRAWLSRPAHREAIVDAAKLWHGPDIIAVLAELVPVGFGPQSAPQAKPRLRSGNVLIALCVALVTLAPFVYIRYAAP